jgi:precorrin isomerase
MEVGLDHLEAFCQATMSGREIVVDQNVVALGTQYPRRMTADITRSSSNQHSHENLTGINSEAL